MQLHVIMQNLQCTPRIVKSCHQMSTSHFVTSPIPVFSNSLQILNVTWKYQRHYVISNSDKRRIFSCYHNEVDLASHRKIENIDTGLFFAVILGLVCNNNYNINILMYLLWKNTGKIVRKALGSLEMQQNHLELDRDPEFQYFSRV